MSQPDLFRLPRKPWNAGRMIGAKAPLKPKHIWAIRQHLKPLDRYGILRCSTPHWTPSCGAVIW